MRPRSWPCKKDQPGQRNLAGRHPGHNASRPKWIKSHCWPKVSVPRASGIPSFLNRATGARPTSRRSLLRGQRSYADAPFLQNPGVGHGHMNTVHRKGGRCQQCMAVHQRGGTAMAWRCQVAFPTDKWIVTLVARGPLESKIVVAVDSEIWIVREAVRKAAASRILGRCSSLMV